MPSAENTDDPAHHPAGSRTDGRTDERGPRGGAATTAPLVAATLRAAATLRTRARRSPRGRRPPEDRLLVATLLVAATAVVAAGSAGIVSGPCGRGCDEEQPVPPPLVVAAPPAPAAPPPVDGPTPATTRVSPRALAARIAAAAGAQGTVSMTLTGSGVRTLVGEGVVRYAGAPAAGDAGDAGDADLSVRLRVGDERLRTVLAGRDLFFAPPRPLAGRDWIRTPRGAAGPLRSEWSDAVTGLVDAARPWRAAGEAVEVSEAGTLRVDGRVLTRYLLRPPVARSTDGAAATVDGTCQPLHALLGAAGPADVAGELLVDAGGLPRRLVTTVRGAHGTSVTTVEYRSWGVRVRIPLPPPSQVVEAETTRT